jgi:hypothetical protein
MKSNTTEDTIYHLISLEGQEFFPGGVDVNQPLVVDKAQLMSAISSHTEHPFGLAYESASAALHQSPIQVLECSDDSYLTDVEVPSPAMLEAVVVTATEFSDIDPVTALPESRDDFERLIASNVSHDTEYLLQDVQETLGSLTGMANRLAEQKKDTLKLQKTLHGRDIALQEKERLLGEKEESLRQMHKQLLHDRNLLNQEAESNAQVIAERSATLQQLTSSLEARERASARRAELLHQENTRADELSTMFRGRLAQLQKREDELERKGQELNENLKHLKSAKDRFSTIVKSFNETVNLGSEPQSTVSINDPAGGDEGYV